MALAAMYQTKQKKNTRHSTVTPEEVRQQISNIDEGIRQAGMVTGEFKQDDKTLVAVEVGDLKTIRKALEEFI